MIGQQLNLFTSSGSSPLAADSVEAQLRVPPVHTVTPEAADTAEPAGDPDTTPDDGTLHWMLTGQPEPAKAA